MKKKLVLMTSALMAMSLLSACNTHTHDWGEVTYTWSSDNLTCTAERVCKSDESHKETETAQSTYAVVTEAKCETDGKGRYSVSFENEAFAAQSKDVVIDALEHDYKFDSFVWAEFNAQAKYICSHDASHVKFYDATVTSEVTTNPGCETKGVRTYMATYDGHTDTKTEEIDALNHDYQFVEFVWAEDYSAKAKFVCTHNETHVDLREATVSSEITTEPSCTVDGVRTYTASYGDHSDTKDQAIPAGHKWGETTYDWAEDHSTCTATRVCEYNHEHVVSETANSTNAITKEPTCGEEGVRTYTAHFENELLEDDIYEESIPMGDHKWGEISYAYNDDYTQCTASVTCIYNSEHVESETVSSSVKWEDQGETKKHYLGYRCFDFKNDQLEDKKEPLFKADILFDYLEGFLVRAPEGATLNGKIDIPQYIVDNWYPINTIDSSGFRDQPMISVSIPRSIDYIGEYAFAGCSNLKTVYFSGSKWDWDFMSREDNWCEGAPIEKIVCTDGVITL